jgi:hypothetical protein
MNGFDPITLISQLLFGFLVKKWPALALVPNKLIPVFNAVLAVLIQLVHPVQANADSLTVVPIQHGHPGWWGLWQFLQPVLLNTLLSTGIFSSVKNVGEHVGNKS